MTQDLPQDNQNNSDSDASQDFYNQGLTKAKAGDRYGAIQSFSKVIDTETEVAEAYYQRGLLLFDLGDHQGAIADYNQALSLHPQYLDAYIARSMTKIAIADLNAAQADIAQALELNPKSATAHQLLGLTYKQQNQIEKAIATYKKAASLFLELRDEENCRRCIESYKPLEALLPPSQEEIFANVQQKIDQSDYTNALIDLNWLLQIEPKNSRAFCLRGLVLGKLGDPQGAIKDLNQAQFLEPQNPEIRIGRGKIRVEIGDAQGAIADFNELLREYPSNSEIYINRARAYLKLKDYRTAIEDFSRSLAIDPNNPQLYCDRAEARYDFGDLKGAIADYQQAANIWFNQSSMDRYRYALARINLWQSELEKQTQEAKRKQANAAATVDLMQMPSLELQQRLLALVGGNMAIAQRLIDIAKQDHPNMPEVWYWQKVVFDLESDQK
ncbi:MAG: tetratricopeptide repeat protein [Pseudanabaena sp. M090S1SP1A06QC]|jgi:tetratricopeptide (TPR) repeat protein|nr:tetratricopeptide repeat protein [Pseudanabaena sp. M109S1SP1A06QC]MCA6606277.1 tetratricopeptide repeat protein [Pseudanabaena sp. M007S1SP1A06QC]MCA6615924.1 tetratricopeptide repeat protein [Pseudanabaena sp. M090S1SP1A06QC]MCE2978134.1 tetratricopeptide repeat protein [Pseudanabaena sp. CoA8_M7]